MPFCLICKFSSICHKGRILLKSPVVFFSVHASRNIYLTCHISLPKSEKLLFQMSLPIFQNDLLLSSSTTYNSCCVVKKKVKKSNGQWFLFHMLLLPSQIWNSQFTLFCPFSSEVVFLMLKYSSIGCSWVCSWDPICLSMKQPKPRTTFKCNTEVNEK